MVTTPDWLAVLVDGDGDPPFRIGCFVDDVTGHIGNDVTPSRDFCWFIVDSGQSGHIHPDLDRAPVTVRALLGLVPPGEQVQEDVGPDLIDPPSIPFRFQCSGEAVDPSHRPGRLRRRQVETLEIGRAVLTLF